MKNNVPVIDYISRLKGYLGNNIKLPIDFTKYSKPGSYKIEDRLNKSLESIPAFKLSLEDFHRIKYFHNAWLTQLNISKEEIHEAIELSRKHFKTSFEKKDKIISTGTIKILHDLDRIDLSDFEKETVQEVIALYNKGLKIPWEMQREISVIEGRYNNQLREEFAS